MLKPRKRFGQHLLADKNIIHQIIASINPKSGDHLIEIGPGQGALTFPLIEAYPELKLNLIEIDRDLVNFLKNQIQSNHIHIYEKDVLSFDFSEIKLSPLRIIGNLPYNISTPLLFHLIKYRNIIKDMYFMLQKEVVDRIAAMPHTKDYGRLSVMIQYDFEVTPLFDVPPTAFYPTPKVESAVIKLAPKLHIESDAEVNYSLFQQIVHEAFQYRRKTLKNALKAYFTEEAMIKYGINPILRPEALSVADYVKLATQMSNKEC
jgi:16S rRNA (adenine1518-N6/adenine1519-N6)-dimethyltransferase